MKNFRLSFSFQSANSFFFDFEMLKKFSLERIISLIIKIFNSIVCRSVDQVKLFSLKIIVKPSFMFTLSFVKNSTPSFFIRYRKRWTFCSIARPSLGTNQHTICVGHNWFLKCDLFWQEQTCSTPFALHAVSQAQHKAVVLARPCRANGALECLPYRVKGQRVRSWTGEPAAA